MTTLLRIVVAALAIFFAMGAGLAWWGVLESGTYIVITGLIGSIASVLGLIALGSPRLTASDVRNVEADLFRSIADQAKSAKEYEEKLASNREELSRLEEQRTEVELLVRQASLKLFMEERLRYLAVEIEKRVSADTILDDLLSNYENAVQRVSELDSQIERSEKADAVQRILTEIRADGAREREFYVRLFGQRINIGPALSSIENVATSYGRAMGVALNR